MRKNSFFLFLFLFTGPLSAQKENLKINPFKLVVTVTEYANALAGDMEYVLTEDQLVISHYSVITPVKGVMVSKKLSPGKTLQLFSNMDLTMFETVYNNDKIMITSGQMISITYEKGTQTKDLIFHCYYSRLLAQMTDLFNELMPNDYKIEVCMIL